jgi:general secretion pathway protein E
MEMPADIHAALQRVISQPQGMLMVTGPTGSGKTTTLYGVLLQLIKPAVKIITIEDPVEYRIEGLTQAQVNPKLTFAKALKAMLRQDPDVILVGEIRDDETAGIAAQSALTGHLVLTTLHTNSALMTLSRMLDLKVDPNVLAASMGGILAQRLVRRLCQHCRLGAPLTHEVAKLIEKSGVPAETISAHSSLYTHNPHGCEHCKSGWSGRKGIYELLLPTQAVRLAIEESSLKDLARAAETQPQYRTLLHDAMLNVLSGDTSLAEALDVTGREVL